MNHRSRLGRGLLAAGLLATGLTSQGYGFADAARYSESRNGHALLIQIDGKIVFERYANGWPQTKAHRLASATKSFTGFMLMTAVQDGLLKLDEKVADTLTEWQTDTRKSKITYRQLLSLTSGLWGGVIGVIPSYADAIKSRTIADPGVRFSYGPVPFQTFGEALKRKLAKTNRTVSSYYKAKLLDPLKITGGFWNNFNKGEPRLPSGVYLPARELAKFGELIRQGGVYGNKRLLRADLLAECFKPTKVNPNYGLTFWLPGPTDPMPRDLVYAAGAGKQRVFVIPSHRMVVVRFGESTGWNDQAFLDALMPPVMSYGKGTKGTGGLVPTLTTGGQPAKLGNRAFGLRATRVLRQAAGLVLIGGQSAAIPFAGGSLLVNPDVALGVPMKANGLGVATLPLPIPNDRSLIGAQAFLQAGFTDSAAVAGISLTPGLYVRVLP